MACTSKNRSASGSPGLRKLAIAFGVREACFRFRQPRASAWVWLMISFAWKNALPQVIRVRLHTVTAELSPLRVFGVFWRDELPRVRASAASTFASFAYFAVVTNSLLEGRAPASPHVTLPHFRRFNFRVFRLLRDFKSDPFPSAHPATTHRASDRRPPGT